MIQLQINAYTNPPFHFARVLSKKNPIELDKNGNIVLDKPQGDVLFYGVVKVVDDVLLFHNNSYVYLGDSEETLKYSNKPLLNPNVVLFKEAVKHLDRSKFNDMKIKHHKVSRRKIFWYLPTKYNGMELSDKDFLKLEDFIMFLYNDIVEFNTLLMTSKLSTIFRR